MTTDTQSINKTSIAPRSTENRAQGRIRSSCGSKLKGTWFESRLGRMFVIRVLYIYTRPTVFQTVQRPGECSAVYGTMYHEEPLKSFDKSRT